MLYLLYVNRYLENYSIDDNINESYSLIC